MFRRGDPRRYSMWFARWYAWEYTKKLSVQFDFIVFCRPDLLWMMPAPTKSFFDDFTSNRQTQVWVHATYFCETADTFAFLPSYEAANIYFSLSDLVKGGVACLGGPHFNRELVRNRLANENISTVDSDWCADEDLGWSERILRRKLKSSGLDLNHINAVSTGIFLHVSCSSICNVHKLTHPPPPRAQPYCDLHQFLCVNPLRLRSPVVMQLFQKAMCQF